MRNSAVRGMARGLKKASSAHKAPIWARLAELALKPAAAQRTVNLNHLSRMTKPDSTVVVPGKVLGTGNLSHKITLYSFSISAQAASKIAESGGRILGAEDMIKENPQGTGVLLIG